MITSIELGGLFLIDELGKGMPDVIDGIGIAWVTLGRLCRRNVNFLFTTHFPKIKEILKISGVQRKVKWARFESFLKIERTTNRKILSFSHQIVFPLGFEEDPEQRPDYGNGMKINFRDRFPRL